MKKIFACVLSILLCAPYAFASDIGRVTYVDGRADIVKAGQEMAVPIRAGEAVSSGDSVRTKSNSKAEIKFNDNSTLRLAQNTRVEIKNYELDKDNKRKTATIKLDRGKARTIIAKMPDAAEFNIFTPNAEGKVKGSDIFAFYQAGSSGMLVAEGKMELKNVAHPENILNIPAGSSALVNLDEAPKGPRPYMDLEKKMYEQETFIPPSAPKQGDTSAIKGVFVKISGKVTITPKGASAVRPANLNDIIGEGDNIETGNDGLVEIKFDNGCGMNLKPDTQVKITQLVIDPKTGEYQNLFESSRGKIKARIENLKGGSTFSVKTPTAICGARGTFMYLDITPAMVKAFFEGGNGYLQNLISGAETDIGMGNNSSADNQGNNSNPAPTSNEERDSWTQGWDTDNGTSGYSSGGSNDASENLGTGDNSGGNNNADNANNNGNGANNNGNTDNIYIPPEPASTEPASDNSAAPSMSLAGWFVEGSHFSGNISGDIFGSISGDPLSLDGENWGIWKAGMGGWFYTDNPPQKEWEALVGGEDEGGGYWFGEISGTRWTDDKLSATIAGYSLTEREAGTFDGNIIGRHYIGDGGQWEAVAGGYWENRALTSSGYFDNGIYQLQDISDGIYINAEVGYTSGLLGLTDSIWDNGAKPKFLSIGTLSGVDGDYSLDYNKPFIWHSIDYGLSSGENYTTYDDGAFYGISGGTGTGGNLSGLALAFYIDHDGNAGILSGDLSGKYSSDINMYILQGELANTFKEWVDMSPQDLAYNRNQSELTGYGMGEFGGELSEINYIDIKYMSGVTLGITDLSWGIWGINIGGDYYNINVSPNWTVALGGVSNSQMTDPGYWIGTMSGDNWNDGQMASSYTGFFFSAAGDGYVKAGTAAGKVLGNYIEVSENQGTWQAIGAGEWVEVTDLLSEYAMFGEGGLTELGNFVNVPITEVYASTLNVNGSFNGGVGAITANMNTSFYGNTISVNNGIWAATVSGIYSGMPNEVASWNANITGNTGAGSVSAIITGTQWSNNQWVGTVNSSEGSAINFSGQVAGTYTPTDSTSGNLTGAGAGTWTKPEAP